MLSVIIPQSSARPSMDNTFSGVSHDEGSCNSAFEVHRGVLDDAYNQLYGLLRELQQVRIVPVLDGHLALPFTGLQIQLDACFSEMGGGERHDRSDTAAPAGLIIVRNVMFFQIDSSNGTSAGVRS